MDSIFTSNLMSSAINVHPPYLSSPIIRGKPGNCILLDSLVHGVPHPIPALGHVTVASHPADLASRLQEFLNSVHIVWAVQGQEPSLKRGATEERGVRLSGYGLQADSNRDIH